MSNSGTEKSADISNFAQRCNLLSQYLKEKGRFGDINLEMTGKSEAKDKDASIFPGAPLSIWPEKKSSTEMNPRLKAESSDLKSMDFVQKLSGSGLSTSTRDTTNKSDFRKPATLTDSGNAQLTIFFAGKVIVYNEFPVNKANEIMDLANQANSKTSCDVVPVNAVPDNVVPDNTTVKNDASLGNPVIPDLNAPSVNENNGDHQTRQHQLVERIARRASLHRFFAKRKDRAAARAPYQANQDAALPPKPDVQARPALEKGQSSGQIKNNDAASPKPEKANDQLLDEDQCANHLELRL